MNKDAVGRKQGRAGAEQLLMGRTVFALLCVTECRSGPDHLLSALPGVLDSCAQAGLTPPAYAGIGRM